MRYRGIDFSAFTEEPVRVVLANIIWQGRDPNGLLIMRKKQYRRVRIWEWHGGDIRKAREGTLSAGGKRVCCVRFYVSNRCFFLDTHLPARIDHYLPKAKQWETLWQSDDFERRMVEQTLKAMV